MADDEFGADADFLAALAATDVGGVAGTPSNKTSTSTASSAPRPTPQRPPPPHLAQSRPQVEPRIQQPAPQRMQRPGAGGSTPATAPRIVQPTPQALSGPPGSSTTPGASASAAPGPGAGTATNATATRLATRPASSGSTILVSPRQKGNSVLAQIRSVPWEYSDIVADYQLGVTTCALYLSLKYHRLHPEYIFARFRRLQGKFRLRILLTLVDIDNHEDPLRELSKTSLVNEVTLILCWSTAEAARYLELYKSFEHASNFAAIRGQQAAGYAERLVQFTTVPRAINKTDAISLVSSFGSLRNAVLADAEQLGLVSGWGQKKVQAWRRAVDAPFRVQKGARRPRAKTAAAAASATQAQKQKQKAAAAAAAAASADATQLDIEEDAEEAESANDFDSVFNGRLQSQAGALATPQPTLTPAASSMSAAPSLSPGKAAPQELLPTPAPEPARQRPPEDALSDGVAAALARLRK